MQEAIAWAGRVMLHKEVSIVDLPTARQPAPHQTATSSKHQCLQLSTDTSTQWVSAQDLFKPTQNWHLALFTLLAIM